MLVSYFPPLLPIIILKLRRSFICDSMFFCLSFLLKVKCITENYLKSKITWLNWCVCESLIDKISLYYVMSQFCNTIIIFAEEKGYKKIWIYQRISCISLKKIDDKRCLRHHHHHHSFVNEIEFTNNFGTKRESIRHTFDVLENLFTWFHSNLAILLGLSLDRSFITRVNREGCQLNFPNVIS